MRVRFEEIPAGRGIREAHVQVGPGSEGVRPGLGHEGGDAAEAPRHVLGHQPEENHPIRHGQRIGVIEVELVLPVTTLMVEGVDPPAERVHVLDHRLQEGIGLYRRLQVVAAGRQVDRVVDATKGSHSPSISRST